MGRTMEVVVSDIFLISAMDPEETKVVFYVSSFEIKGIVEVGKTVFILTL